MGSRRCWRAWLRGCGLAVESLALHPAIRADPDQLGKARLFLWLCLLSGPLLLLVITCWGVVSGETIRAAIVGVGHVIAVSSCLALRFRSSVRGPARLMGLTAVLQLTSAAWWTGGIGSVVVGTFPVATVFLGFIDDTRLAVGSAAGLVLGLVLLAVLPALGLEPGVPVAEGWVLAAVCVWALGTGLGVALLHQHQSGLHLERLSRELAMRTQAQGEAERLRDQREGFLRYISHELRNPLTTIAGNLEYHSLSDDASRKERALRSVQLASDRLLRLADDVLDFSSLERGRLQLEQQRVDVAAACAACLDELEGQAEARGQSIRLEAGAPIWVDGDFDRLVQIVANLVSNSVKYAEGTPIRVSVRSEGTRVCIQVSDSGPGIPAELIPVLFEPFARARGASEQGSGLGLGIARELARSMGGDLRLLDGVGPGAHFEVSLPVSGAGPG